MSKQNRELGRIADSVAALGTAPTPRNPAHADPREKLPLMARLIMMVGYSDRKMLRARAVRRSFPIRAEVGPNGGGKSLCAVDNTLPSLAAGRTVLSTIKLLDHRTGEPHKAYEPFYDIDQLLTARNLDCLMDEVTGIANSRAHADVPTHVINKLVQLRRVGVTVDITTPNLARADKIIREVMQVVTECRGYFPAKVAPVDGELTMWAPKRVFRFMTYDTVEFEEWTAKKADKIDPIVSTWFKGPGSQAFSSYDTMDGVTPVAMRDGTECLTCGGKVRQAPCRCQAPVLRPLPDLPTSAYEELPPHDPTTGELDEAFEAVDRAHFAGHDQAFAMIGEGTAVV